MLKKKEPIVEPSKDVVTYPDAWATDIHINASDPLNVSASAIIRPSRVNGVGQHEILMDPDKASFVNVDHIMQKIAVDPTGIEAQAFGAIMIFLMKYSPDLEDPPDLSEE